MIMQVTSDVSRHRVDLFHINMLLKEVYSHTRWKSILKVLLVTWLSSELKLEIYIAYFQSLAISAHFYFRTVSLLVLPKYMIVLYCKCIAKLFNLSLLFEVVLFFSSSLRQSNQGYSLCLITHLISRSNYVSLGTTVSSSMSVYFGRLKLMMTALSALLLLSYVCCKYSNLVG
jgi:hypothetical protein